MKSALSLWAGSWLCRDQRCATSSGPTSAAPPSQCHTCPHSGAVIQPKKSSHLEFHNETWSEGHLLVLVSTKTSPKRLLTHLSLNPCCHPPNCIHVPLTNLSFFHDPTSDLHTCAMRLIPHASSSFLIFFTVLCRVCFSDLKVPKWPFCVNGTLVLLLTHSFFVFTWSLSFNGISCWKVSKISSLCWQVSVDSSSLLVLSKNEMSLLSALSFLLGSLQVETRIRLSFCLSLEILFSVFINDFWEIPTKLQNSLASGTFFSVLELCFNRKWKQPGSSSSLKTLLCNRIDSETFVKTFFSVRVDIDVILEHNVREACSTRVFLPNQRKFKSGQNGLNVFKNDIEISTEVLSWVFLEVDYWVSPAAERDLSKVMVGRVCGFNGCARNPMSILATVCSSF